MAPRGRREGVAVASSRWRCHGARGQARNESLSACACDGAAWGTQMFDTQDWTTVADKREDRQEYSDILDEDTGFSEVREC